jgi:integrase
VRLSEARGATTAALNLDRQIYRLTQRADERNKIGPVKSGSGRRELELSEGLCTDLRAWLAVKPDGKLLFGNGQDRPEGMQNIYKRFWLPLLVECGLAVQTKDENGRKRHDAQFGIHDLRHFHASLMIEQGMQPKQLQEHMGHSSIQVTMDTYGHLFRDDDARARRRALIVDADAALLDAPKPITQSKTATETEVHGVRPNYRQ